MKIDFPGKNIVVSNVEMKRARNYGSPECATLMRAMKDLPDFQIIVQRPRVSRDPFAGWTYEMMESHIKLVAPERIEEFRRIRVWYRSYPRVKQWFLAEFPEVKENPWFAE